VDRVEIARGALGDVYGPDAAGGVVQVFTRQAGERWRGLVMADAGEQGTARLSAWTGHRPGGVAWTLAGEAFDSDGAIPVEPASRGAVDRPAGVDARSGIASLRVAVTGSTAVSGRAEVFDERRGNGTVLQRNDTNFRQGSLELASAGASGGIRARVARSSQGFDQSFTAVSADRSRETLTSEQRVGAERTQVSAEWTGASSLAAWLAGAEGRWSSGRNRELRYVAGVPAGVTELGGDHDDLGAFAQAVLPVRGANVLTAGVRLDAWRIDLPGAGRRDRLVRWSPRVAWSRALAPSQVLHASVYRAFRPPTLNELIRGFRVGNVQTLANAGLEPETLTGGEVAWHLQRGAGSLRAVAFLTSLDDAIVNVTLSSTPALITRERQNAGRVRSRGVELESSWTVTRGVSLRGALALTDATFVESADAALLGKRVPQVPRWQASIGLDGTAGAVGGAVAVRLGGAQFDDDRNQFELNPATVADASAWWRPHPRVTVIGAVENVADAVYDVGRTPVRTVGTPRLARVGVRVGW
jgi:outer membrane receptor protein involved in Fe transport